MRSNYARSVVKKGLVTGLDDRIFGSFFFQLIQKTLDVLSPLRPIVHDTSKTAKITWFILVLHWAVDVIEVITS